MLRIVGVLLGVIGVLCEFFLFNVFSGFFYDRKRYIKIIKSVLDFLSKVWKSKILVHIWIYQIIWALKGGWDFLENNEKYIKIKEIKLENSKKT